MNAVVSTAEGGYRDVLRLQQFPVPKLHDGMLLVKVECCGLAFPDVLTVEGKHIMKKTAPFVPGAEICGKIIQIGSDDAEENNLKVGDRVFGVAMSGALAEVASMLADSVYKLPSDAFDPAVAAGFELNYGTTWHGLKDVAKLSEGETLLVLGAAGGVGMAAIDIGKALGATVVACASTPAKLAAAAKQGADVLINYTEGNFKAQLKDAGVYGDVDVVYDPVGGALSEVALRAMGWGGRFVVVGFAAGGATPKDAIPKIPLNLALLNERQILGVFWGAWKMRDGNQGNRENIETMLKLVVAGKLNPTISKVYHMKQFMHAFDDLMQRKVIGKICVSIDHGSSL